YLLINQPPIKGVGPHSSIIKPWFSTNPHTYHFLFAFLIVCVSSIQQLKEMGLGRGSAMVLLLCFLVLHSEMVRAATYTVGGTGGWTFNTVGWPSGKRFRAVFNYNPAIHNVVVVNKAGYNTCKTPIGAKVYRSGKDQIKIVKGQNYFICNYVGHCESGMKIAINAA
ncbi:Basic blue protein, partial [Mucuna pruriens]